jgi:hypothetical protein
MCSWASDIAFALVGISSIGFNLFLRRQNKLEPLVVAGPRRGFVFALLGGRVSSPLQLVEQPRFTPGNSAFWYTDQ